MYRFSSITSFIRSAFNNKDFIGLHEPSFRGDEKKYVIDAIDSTYVSSVGSYVDKCERFLESLVQVKSVVAVVNGTAAVQVALRLAGVKPGDEVLTQSLSFIATANAIIYNGASPVFIDVDLDTMGFSPTAMDLFLEEFAELKEDGCYNKLTGKKISACLPMHTFGFPVKIDEIIAVCKKWNIPMVEDATESLGSKYKNKPTGGFGITGSLSFNGNKIVTSGGGGAIICDDVTIGKLGKHLTTTAKVPHQYEFVHDAIGYNYRMPNINAALLCAQLEQLDFFVESKRQLAIQYEIFFKSQGIKFRVEPKNTKSNYWLMSIELENLIERNKFLKELNNSKIMTRPIWQLLFRMPMYANCQRDEQKNAIFLEERIVNIPSSAR